MLQGTKILCDLTAAVKKGHPEDPGSAAQLPERAAGVSSVTRGIRAALVLANPGY